MMVAKNNHVEIIELLLKAGADVNVKTRVSAHSEFDCFFVNCLLVDLN